MALSDSQTGRRPFRRRSEARPPTSPEPPPLATDRLPCMLFPLPRWTESGARWLTSRAFPRRFLPCPYSLPRFSGGSASTTSLSRPAQALHALRPARLLTHLRGLYREAPPLPVSRLERSQAIKSNQQLLEWVLPPLVICPVGAHGEMRAKGMRRFCR